MEIVEFTRARSPELADCLEACCLFPLSFEGEDPNHHSSANHIHLWQLEQFADHFSWIDLDYRTWFVQHIFTRWRGRLKGLPPYQNAGYRIYLYEDLAPTVSVVAETSVGFPYPVEATFVDSPRDIMALYVGRSWRANFSAEPWPLSPKKVLETIEANQGSVSKPSADGLGLKVGQLRILIEQMGLENRVNAIRKRFKRRPANFREEKTIPNRHHFYELRLPAGYR